METTTIEKAFQDILKKKPDSFTSFVLGLSKELELEIAITDIRDDGFKFLNRIGISYRVKTITGSQFIFITVALAYRQHTNYPDCARDRVYIDYLMSMTAEAKLRKILSAEKLDFYNWYIKNRIR